jgi:pimeloyl-ACP methyl ester carboxylesterase
MPADPVQATAPDGVVLRGELVRGGTTTWLVLLHDVDEDLDAWRPLRPRLHGTEWNLLALDLRGHGGSDGEWSAEDAPLDCLTGVRVARATGAEHVSLVAAGRSAVAALQATALALADPRLPLADSLVLLSPRGLDDADPAALRGEGLAMLLLHGALDPQAAEDAARLLRLAIGWSVSVSFGSELQGTALLQGPPAKHVADKMASFLRERAVVGGPGLKRARAADVSP